VSWFSDLFFHLGASARLAVANATSVQHHVLASNFADAADKRGFLAAKARGLSDVQAFRYGDNCVGFWDDDTSGKIPMCALPPEDIIEKWGSENAGKHRLVRVKTPLGVPVLCLLADVMPHRGNIKNGCGIDLNPGACAALFLKTPCKTPVSWEWVS